MNPASAVAAALLSLAAGPRELCAQREANERAPLVGVVVDPDGRPVAGAMLEVSRLAGAGMEILDLDYRYSRSRVARTPTDRNGRFALQLPVGVPVRMVVDHAPFARWVREDVLPGDELRVELQQPATLTGRVTGPDGQGLPGSVRIWNLRDRTHYVEDGRTAADGTFRFERLPGVTVRVAIVPDRARAPSWQEVALAPGATTDLPVATELGAVLRGRVTDDAGAPIAGAIVGENWTMRRKVTTGADGRYELPGYIAPGVQEIHCHAAGYVNALSSKDAVGADHVLDFRLERGAVVTGCVHDENGAPVADAYVASVGMIHDGATQETNWVGARTGPDGTFRLGGVRAELQPTLLVRKPGRATVVYHLPAPVAGAIRLEPLTMPQPRVLAGVLLDADDPAADVPLTLIGGNADRAALAAEPKSWSLVDGYVHTRNVRTNSHGQFAFGDLPPGTYELWYRPGSASTSLGRFEVEADADHEPLRLDLSR